MTLNSNDFVKFIQPRGTTIANANKVTCPVTKAEAVASSSSLSLSNTLLVPSLSNKLISVGQVTEDLKHFILFRIFSTRSLAVVLKREGCII